MCVSFVTSGFCLFVTSYFFEFPSDLCRRLSIVDTLKEYLLKKGGASFIPVVRKADELCRWNLYHTPQWYLPHLSWAVGKSCPFSRETRGTVEGRAGSFANNHHGIIVPVPVTPSSYCILCGIRDIV